MGARQSCGKACSNCAADCARSANAYGDDFDDERPGGDPAGATFEETLEELNGLDRQLMLFCATSNLSAVRWLLHLGAHWDASDANGTTCLHVACRAGALAIVKELMQYRELMKVADVAGWTALHIAVLMGRKEVVVRLLQAGAPLKVRNGKGQEPAELCADNGTYEALRSFELHQQQALGRPWEFGSQMGPGEDIVGSRLQYEPFFVPRQPVIRSGQFKKEFQRLGMLMFNRQPGFGLAFLVASGVARDYPVDMSNFLRRSKVDIKQVGNFLGEAFSLSHTIRLEFVNSVVLQNTGIVSALIQVFHMLQLPDDLQKINRLVHGVARIWWRQHERLQKDMQNGVPNQRRMRANDGALTQLHLPDELVGLELKQYFTCSDALHQLMFSTVLLHWIIYRDGTGQKHSLDYTIWRKLNAGLESGGGDVPDHVQHQIFALINRAFIPELAVASSVRLPDSSQGDVAAGRTVDPKTHGQDSAPGWRSILSQHASNEGWVQIVGGGFPRPSGLQGMQTVTYRHVSSIFSEVTHNGAGSHFGTGNAEILRPRHQGVQSASALQPSSASSMVPIPAGSGRHMTEMVVNRQDDQTYMSLVYTLLFFAGPLMGGVPYAFIELKRLVVAAVDREARVMTLAGSAEVDGPDPEFSVAEGHGPCAENYASKGRHHPVSIVLLLPDGRWQEMSLPKLELRVATQEDLQNWVAHLGACSQGKPAVATPLFVEA